MSGAAEGIAGLALSAISVAALFTTCIECFDIVVAGKNFSEDYEQLCALFSLQRARFGLWGESVGLVPNPDGQCLRYDRNLDRADIRPGVERILNNIKSLLEEAGKVDERYGLSSNIPQGSEVSNSKGLDIFKGSFERFKSRIRKHQRETSAWKVTRWAIHDADKFEGMLNRLKDFVDGLESITKSLGLLREQHERLHQEIESISDTQSLRILRDASSRHGSSQQDVSDAASQRLITVAESFIDTQTLDFSSHFPASTDSFVTARSGPSKNSGSFLEDGQHIPGEWPGSLKSSSYTRQHRTSTLHSRPRGGHKPRASCQQCLDEHYKCVPALEAEDGRCSRCVQTQKDCSLVSIPQEAVTESTLEPLHFEPAIPMDESASTQGLPQHQRLLSDLLKKANPRKPLSFAAGDSHYGEHLAPIKDQDEKYWLKHSGRILGQANSGSSAAKRMFFELRNIRAGKVPFVSAVPLDDNLTKILASIEGPPETPYEGGVFFITVTLSETDPFGPPLMRFNTKVYHPNISPQGHICADYKEKWNAVLSAGTSRLPVSDAKALWYPPKSGDARWSLGALLTALCGLLASPDVDDPLVPEIAQKFLEDYAGYCENAKCYTQRHATGPQPELQDLIFAEDSSQSASEVNSVFSSISRLSSTIDAMSLETTSPSFEVPVDGQPSTETSGTQSPVFGIPIDGFAISEGHSLLEVDTLHLYINGRALASFWKLHTRNRNKADPDRPPPDLFSDLIRITRSHLNPLFSRFIDTITDLNICLSLLEAAQLYLVVGEGHYFNYYDHLEVSRFYTAARDLCTSSIAVYLKHGEIKTKHVKNYTFNISIITSTKFLEWPEGLKNWTFTRTLDRIQDFITLQHELSLIFQSHSKEILNKNESIQFLRPDCKTLKEATSQNESNRFGFINYAPFRLKPFIHPSLIKGIKVLAKGTLNISRKGPAVLFLKQSTDGKFNIMWLVRWRFGWPIYEESSDVQNLGPFELVTEGTQTSALTIHYKRSGGAGCRSVQAALQLDFRSTEEAVLCVETLQALLQIEKRLWSDRESLKRSFSIRRRPRLVDLPIQHLAERSGALLG